MSVRRDKRSPFWSYNFQIRGHRFYGSTKCTTRREAEAVERVEREKAKQSAISKLVSTFFEGSAKAAVTAFLDPGTANLSDEDLKELERAIRKARKEKTS